MKEYTKEDREVITSFLKNIEDRIGTWFKFIKRYKPEYTDWEFLQVENLHPTLGYLEACIYKDLPDGEFETDIVFVNLEFLLLSEEEQKARVDDHFKE